MASVNPIELDVELANLRNREFQLERLLQTIKKRIVQINIERDYFPFKDRFEWLKARQGKL